MFFSKFFLAGVLFFSFTTASYGASREQFQVLSKWFQEHYQLSAKPSVIPSYDCEINVSFTTNYFRILIYKRNIQSSMTVSVDKKPHQYNDYQDKLFTTIANNELLVDFEATSCETQGCTDILFPKNFLRANDHYIELKDFDAFPEETLVGCSLK